LVGDGAPRGAYHRRGYAFCAASGVAGWQQPAGILDYPLRGSDSSASLALSRERVRLRLRPVSADRVALAPPDAPPRSLLLPFAGEPLRLGNLRRSHSARLFRQQTRQTSIPARGSTGCRTLPFCAQRSRAVDDRGAAGLSVPDVCRGGAFYWTSYRSKACRAEG